MKEGPSRGLLSGVGMLPGAALAPDDSGALPPASPPGDSGVPGPASPADTPAPITPSDTEGAPLGFDDEYESEWGSADEELVHTPSHTASALQPGEVFRLQWVAMVPEGTAPVPNGPRYSFKEGDSVDLYAQYEVAANTPYVRRWTIDTAGLDFTEEYRTHTVGGEYRAKLNYVLPIGSAAINASLVFEAYYGTSRSASSASDRTASLVVIEPEQGFEIIDIVMVKDGQAPDWSLTRNQFYEGDAVDLWMHYHITSPSLNMNRHWESPDIDLERWEYGLPNANGTHTIKLDHVIPLGSAKENAVFRYDLTSPFLDLTKYSDPFLFDILELTAMPNPAPAEIVNFAAGENVWCGRMCVMTSHMTYPFSKGSADGMVQNYDKRYSQVIDLFDLKTSRLFKLTDFVKDPNQKFRIVIANADHSFGARLSINKTYNGFDSTTYVTGLSYDDTAPGLLPVYSLGGVAGSTKLTKLQLSFSSNTAHDRMIVASSTGAVRKNVRGPQGEYRNGALTLQIVKVNADGTPAYTLDKNMSAGGVQGAATSGLLYETAVHYNWGGPGNNETPWPNYNPGADKKCADADPLTGPRLLARGTTYEIISPLPGITSSAFPSATGQYQMNWEDLLDSRDVDYNDLVAGMKATEYYLPGGALKQVTLYIKALARGNADSSEWQLNMNAAFPGAKAVTTVNQYFDDQDGILDNDLTHEFDGLWSSNGGVAVPVYQNARLALPDPANKTNTANVIVGSDYVEGDYSIIRIVFKDGGVATANYTKAPYTPELRVAPTKGSVYVYNLWQKKGDPLFSNGMPRGGFIVPAAFPWPLEGRSIGTVYSGWGGWVSWLGLNGNILAPATPWYMQQPVANYYQRSLFK